MFAAPPFRYCPLTNQIWGRNEDNDDTPVLVVRGWGYLIGGGYAALGLTDEEAREKQREFGEHVAKLLNDAKIKESAQQSP